MESKWMTVSEAIDFLEQNMKHRYTQVWIRNLCARGTLESKKVYTAKVISVKSLNKFIADRSRELAAI